MPAIVFLGLMFSLLRDTRHLQILAVLILAVGAGAVFLRGQLVPADYGQHGPYRGAALQEESSRPHFLTSDANCLKCHQSVHEERKDSPHTAVRCMHCHGNGHEHMAVAQKAVTAPETKIAPASGWDGNFLTELDLFITKDRAICLSCHQKVVGMPDSFRAIVVDQHLEEQGATDAASPDVCFECHTGHSPGI